jgi:hypothetical protein
MTAPKPTTPAQIRAMQALRLKREVTYREAIQVNGRGYARVMGALERRGLAVRTPTGWKRVPRVR